LEFCLVGAAGEHEVSLLSAASILKAIDRDKFDVVPIGITKEGRWLAPGDATHLLQNGATGGGLSENGVQEAARSAPRGRS
jgi:D-alanine-D-alanine ligase-like ATP-grasp enzyme